MSIVMFELHEHRLPRVSSRKTAFCRQYLLSPFILALSFFSATTRLTDIPPLLSLRPTRQQERLTATQTLGPVYVRRKAHRPSCHAHLGVSAVSAGGTTRAISRTPTNLVDNGISSIVVSPQRKRRLRPEENA